MILSTTVYFLLKIVLFLDFRSNCHIADNFIFNILHHDSTFFLFLKLFVLLVLFFFVGISAGSIEPLCVRVFSQSFKTFVRSTGIKRIFLVTAGCLNSSFDGTVHGVTKSRNISRILGRGRGGFFHLIVLLGSRMITGTFISCVGGVPYHLN